MLRYIRYYLGLLSCTISVTLSAVSLIDDRRMRDSNYYDKETGIILHSFNIRFHWMTLIRMKSVILNGAKVKTDMDKERILLGLELLKASKEKD